MSTVDDLETRRERPSAPDIDKVVSWGRELLARIPKVPIFFLGVAFYRAWIELVYVRPMLDFPTWRVAGHDVFDFAMLITLLACALVARRLIPLSEKLWVRYGAGLLMVAGTISSYYSLSSPQVATWASYPGTIAAGVGTALIILLWSEFYGCLNTARVALYYSSSLLFSAFIVFLMKGFVFDYAAVFTTLLPVISLICLSMSYSSIPDEDRPKRTWGRFSFPWKPMALMAVYAFAYGMRESAIYVESGPHSSWGVILASALIIAGVVSQSERFDFSLIYRTAFPVMVGGLLIIPLFTDVGSHISNISVSASYAAFSVIIMIILSNISYRYGVGAVWLFGIERGLRALVMWLGRMTTTSLAASGLSSGVQSSLVTSAVVLLVMVCTLLFLSEKELSSPWGVTLLGDDASDDQLREKSRLAALSSTLIADYQLSPREAEVLQLLSQKKTVCEIKDELFISQGTAKAHIAHIYRKMDLHTREELYELLGIM